MTFGVREEMTRTRAARGRTGRHLSGILSFLVAFAMTLVSAPVCQAAGACGMGCCDAAGDLASVTKGAGCCRLESAGGASRLAALEVTPLPTRPAAGAHPVVLSSAAIGADLMALDLGAPNPPGPDLEITAVPLFILNSALLI